MLHTINKSPYSHQCFAECLRVCSTSDAIVLIEDGVYAALANSDYAKSLLAKTSAVYALQPDMLARGLIDRIASAIKAIDYNDFVQLCVDQPKMMAWY